MQLQHEAIHEACDSAITFGANLIYLSGQWHLFLNTQTSTKLATFLSDADGERDSTLGHYSTTDGQPRFTADFAVDSLPFWTWVSPSLSVAPTAATLLGPTHVRVPLHVAGALVFLGQHFLRC